MRGRNTNVTAGLERFKDAQDRAASGFDAALAEIRAGGKRGHWIWYVFPQLAGLGSSHNSRFYGIAGVAEAAEYLRDPVLRRRLLTITGAVAEQLRKGASLEHVMGSEIDAHKLVSSLTLFGPVARKLRAAESRDDCQSLGDLADEILTAAEADGYARCGYTLARLAAG